MVCSLGLYRRCVRYGGLILAASGITLLIFSAIAYRNDYLRNDETNNILLKNLYSELLFAQLLKSLPMYLSTFF